MKNFISSLFFVFCTFSSVAQTLPASEDFIIPSKRISINNPAAQLPSIEWVAPGNTYETVSNNTYTVRAWVHSASNLQSVSCQVAGAKAASVPLKYYTGNSGAYLYEEQIQLSNGENRISIQTRNTAGTVHTTERTINYKAAGKQPKIWAVIVGIEQYTDVVQPLRYSADDAHQFNTFLRSPEGGALPKEQLKLLVDNQAYRENILNALKEKAAQADSEDMLIFYFSGHGSPGAFIPQDYNGSKNSELNHAAVRSAMENSRAKHKIIIADACFSGSFKGSKDPLSVENTLENYYQELIRSKGGIAIITSSKENEISRENDGIQQGVFSYFLIKGLEGAADTDNNKIISIGELSDYLYAQVRNATSDMQSPSIKGAYDRNMPIGALR